MNPNRYIYRVSLGDSAASEFIVSRIERVIPYLIQAKERNWWAIVDRKPIDASATDPYRVIYATCF